MQQIVYVPTEYHADIGYFNVPHGEGKALHLYNRHYASSTKTRQTSVEVILEAGSPENAELTVGGTITAQVVEVRNGNFNTLSATANWCSQQRGFPMQSPWPS